jgi:hypothetical protein
MVETVALTNQSAFDIMCKHLMSMDSKSMDSIGEKCMYRGYEGRKCPVGALIPDADYDPSFELKSIVGLMNMYVPQKLFGHLDTSILGAVQDIHDDEEPESWRISLIAVAMNNGLIKPESIRV